MLSGEGWGRGASFHKAPLQMAVQLSITRSAREQIASVHANGTPDICRNAFMHTVKEQACKPFPVFFFWLDPRRSEESTSHPKSLLNNAPLPKDASYKLGNQHIQWLRIISCQMESYISHSIQALLFRGPTLCCFSHYAFTIYLMSLPSPPTTSWIVESKQESVIQNQRTYRGLTAFPRYFWGRHLIFLSHYNLFVTIITYSLYNSFMQRVCSGLTLIIIHFQMLPPYSFPRHLVECHPILQFPSAII